MLHSVELILSGHPWATLLLGVALPFVALIVLIIALGRASRDTPRRATGETWASLDPRLLDAERARESGRTAEALERDVREVREWSEFKQRLDKLARKVDECATQVHELQADCATQVHELQADAVRRMSLRAGKDDPQAPVPPPDEGGGDSPRGPRGGAGADGPDATMLFPKPATSTGDGVSTAMH